MRTLAKQQPELKKLQKLAKQPAGSERLRTLAKATSGIGRAADIGEGSEKPQDGADCRESAPERTSYAKKKRLERQGARPVASQRQVRKAPAMFMAGAFRTNSWWRRGESNSCPYQILDEALQA